MTRQDFDQYAFTLLLQEAEDAQRAELDEHRVQVQTWFDVLTPEQKEQLNAFMERDEWLTCEALSTAARDWHRSQPDQVAAREMVAGPEAAAKR